MSTILLAVALQDWERYSIYALTARDVAAALASATARHLYVLSVYAYPSINTNGLSPGMAAAYRDEQRQQTDACLARKIAAYVAPLAASGIQVSTSLRVGKPSRVIVQVVRELQADLLVMGMHSKRNLWDVALGGTAWQVSKRAPCAVVLVTPQRSNGVASGPTRHHPCRPALVPGGD